MPLLFALFASAAVGLCACGTGSRTTSSRRTVANTSNPPGMVGPAFGLTEDNPDLLWSPNGAAPRAAAPFLTARRQLTALHPSFLRLLVDWASLQPDPHSSAALQAPVDGCARGVPPCGAYAGLAAELQAIASQQRAHPGSFEVVLDIFGVPAWAALAPHGCERAGSDSFARALRPEAIASYRELILDLLQLGEREGVALRWWSPWNEPNDPRFIAPQRASCAIGSASLAPVVYGQLAQAMAQQLTDAGGEHKLLLGELGGYESGSPHRTSVAEFIAALAPEVLCMSQTWSVHAYATWGSRAPQENPVEALQDALDRRGGCASSAQIWITEAGAGAPNPGQPRTGTVEEEQAGCLALASQVLVWRHDPRVRAIFQYTFRDDPLFPVGLVSSDLLQLYPVYGMWLVLLPTARTEPAPSAQQACSA